MGFWFLQLMIFLTSRPNYRLISVGADGFVKSRIVEGFLLEAVFGVSKMKSISMLFV